MQRIGNGTPDKFNFCFEQEACGSRQKMRNAVYRSMRAVRNAETIINVYIGQRSKFFRKAKVIFFIKSFLTINNSKSFFSDNQFFFFPIFTDHYNFSLFL